ncbi:hypothetical protein Ocin01_18371 [Orchesella cincta]|uniref:Uncharacterized protein n=1 Tax=Orchesella cincta TaxID=48709 RepID=A0A1D2M5P7_ORCCI|nr:hypothetical protein Ocin01_18371 [Orchesella cincta]
MECKRGTRPPVISQEEYMQTEIPTEITSTSIASTPKPGFLSECGQTIVANSGTIEYKLYEKLRCVSSVCLSSGLEIIRP